MKILAMEGGGFQEDNAASKPSSKKLAFQEKGHQLNNGLVFYSYQSSGILSMFMQNSVVIKRRCNGGAVEKR